MLDQIFSVWAHFSKPYCLIDQSGSVLRSNPAFDQIIPLSLRDGNTLLAWNKDQTQSTLASLQKKLLSGSGFLHQFSLRKQEGGAILTIQLEAVAIEDESQTNLIYLASLEALTHAEHDPQRLRLLEGIHKTTKDAIFIASGEPIDAAAGEYQILEVNPAFTQLTGYLAEELVGTATSLLQGQDSDPETLSQINTALAKREQLEVELLNYKKDGTPFWTSQIITPITNEQGHLTHWYAILRDISQQKERETQLAHTTFILKETQKIAQTGGWELDVATGNTIWTEEVYRIHDVPTSFDHNKENGIAFYHPDDQAVLIEALGRAIEKQESFDLRSRFISATGKQKLVKVSGYPVIEQKQVTKLMGIIHDISQITKQESELRTQRERLSIATKAAKMGVWDFFPLENRLVWDDTMYSLYGVSKADFSGAYEAWQQSLDAKSRKKSEKVLFAAMQEGQEIYFEFDIRLPNGELRTLVSEALISRNEAGEAERVIGVNYDITSKKKRMAELNLLHSVVDSAADSIIITTADPEKQEILYANPAHAKMTGYTLKEVLGKSPKMFQGPETDEAQLQLIHESLCKGENISVEIKNYRKGGGIFWVNMIITYVRDEAEKITHFVSIQRDITERKQAEIELKKAKEAAEKASQSKSEFLSTMSHEIRTPLNAVIGVSGLLSNSDLNEEQTELVNTIRLGGENLLSIVNDILDFSKIESGKLELETTDFDISSMIQNIAQLLNKQAFAKGIELLIDIEEKCRGKYLGAPGQISQVLVNLIGNGIKFTDRGEVLVKLRTVAEADDISTIEFAIIDTGIGIPKEKIGSLFHPFSQLDASTTRKYGGTGLGLSISQRLVHAMGGEIWVESEAGIGTSFFVRLPLQKRTETADLGNPYELLKGKHVLLVDDNLSSLKIIEAQLDMVDIKVSAFASPSETIANIDQLAQSKVDLAILDYYMPEMNGLELAKRLKEHEGLSQIPFYLMSAWDLRDQREKLKAFDKKISKPIAQEKLWRYILEALGAPLPKNASRLSSRDQLANFSGFSALLVEDNKINQKVAKMMLQKFKLHVEVANNGQEGLDFVCMSAFDIIFMDMQMPIMDGLEATKKIRALSEAIHQPIIIALTANSFSEDREKCLTAGMNDFLSKPIEINTIEKTLEKWLGTHKVAEIKNELKQ